MALSPFLKEGQGKGNLRFYADPDRRVVKKKDKKKTTTRAFYADPESEHGRWVTKKGQEKDSNSCFYPDPESQHSRWVAKKKDKKMITLAFILLDRVWKYEVLQL